MIVSIYLRRECKTCKCVDNIVHSVIFLLFQSLKNMILLILKLYKHKLYLKILWLLFYLWKTIFLVTILSCLTQPQVNDFFKRMINTKQFHTLKCYKQGKTTPKLELPSAGQAPYNIGFPCWVNILGTHLYQCTNCCCCERLCSD